MTKNEQAEISFLIKAFARYATIPEATILFEEQFGKRPTAWQIGVTNLGRFLEDRRSYFNPKENHRVRKFRMERDKYEASMVNVPLASQTWRMEQYQKIYARAERRSMETGNPSRCLDILQLAAKDVSGAFLQKQQTVNVDNRTVNMNMSNEEIDKRLRMLLGQFGVSLEGSALIEKGANVIEGDTD